MYKEDAIKKIKKFTEDLVCQELKEDYSAKERRDIVKALVNYAEETFVGHPSDELVAYIMEAIENNIKDL